MFGILNAIPGPADIKDGTDQGVPKGSTTIISRTPELCASGPNQPWVKDLNEVKYRTCCRAKEDGNG